MAHMCVTRPQWVNSWWPVDTIWCQACWSTSPSHYLNLKIRQFSVTFDQNTLNFQSEKNALENVVCKMTRSLLWSKNVYMCCFILQVALILLKILQFIPAASVGLLAAICSPPSLLAIPVTSVLRGDVALVSVLTLMADIIGAGM